MKDFRATLMELADEYERLVAQSHQAKEENLLMREQLRHTRMTQDKACSTASLDEIALGFEARIEPPRVFPSTPVAHTRAIRTAYKSSSSDEERSILTDSSPAYIGCQVGVLRGNGDYESEDQSDPASKPLGVEHVDPISKPFGVQHSGTSVVFSEGRQAATDKKPIKGASLGVLSKWFNPDSDNGAASGNLGQRLYSVLSSDPVDLFVLETQTIEPDCATIWPLGTFRLTWDFIAFLCLLVELWATPFELVFLQDADVPLALQVISYCILGFFASDILLNFSTGYVQGDTTIMSRKDIIRAYLKFWFWIDLLSTIPFDVIAETVAGNMFSIARMGKISKTLKILRYLKLVRAIRLVKTMKQASHLRKHFQILGPLRALLQPIQVQIFLLLLAHIHGVVWAAMQPDWIAVDNVADAFGNYYQSFHWAYLSITMASVGQASVESHAIWTLEMIMASERMLIIVLACKQVILHSLAYVDEAQKRQTHKDLLTYFRRHNVSLQTQIQVMFSLTDMRTAQKQQQRYNHLDDLPVQLSRILRVELWSDHLTSMGLVREIATWSHEFVAELCQVATEKVLPSSCVLVHEGTAATASYYILDGELTAAMENSPAYIPNFKKGMWFGENAFVSELLRYSATFSTAKKSSLMSICGSSFLQLVSQLGLMDRFESFCSAELWKGLCGRCGSLGDHFSDRCPHTYGHQSYQVDGALGDEADAISSDQKKVSLSMNSIGSMNSALSRGSDPFATTGSIFSLRRSKSNDLRKKSATSGDPRSRKSVGRGLRRLLQELDLERILPIFANFNIRDIDDLDKLNLSELQSALPEDQKLSEEQELGLSPEYVQHFREKSARKVRNELFRAVSRLHHLMFLSHYKLEAGTEAALIRTELELAIAEDMGSLGHYFDDPIFLDSDNLQNLTDLQQRVENSHNLVLLLTKGVLSRPWCLVEIVTAKREGVRIIPVNVSKPGEVFVYPDEFFYETLRSGDYLDQSATETLAACNCSMADVEDAIRSVFHHIALPYSPHKGRNIRKAEIETLLKQCRLKEEADEMNTVAPVARDPRPAVVRQNSM